MSRRFWRNHLGLSGIAVAAALVLAVLALRWWHQGESDQGVSPLGPPADHPILGTWASANEVVVRGTRKKRGEYPFPYTREDAHRSVRLVISRCSLRLYYNVLGGSSFGDFYRWKGFDGSTNKFVVELDIHAGGWPEDYKRDFLKEPLVWQKTFTDPLECWFLLEGDVLYIGWPSAKLRKWEQGIGQKHWRQPGHILRFERETARHRLALCFCKIYLSELLGRGRMEALFGVPHEGD
ncbi:MAG: hypothetical protein RMJ19_04915 [Gemmatales bacterium]|nr:hypothetical protein [Gemmatales bacterium]MDW8174992.1 hypothetical protein [Gemmatales bacterium]